MTAEETLHASSGGDRSRGESAGSRSRDRSGGIYRSIGKPVLDRLVGVLLLILFAPIVLISALVVRIRIGPPVLYIQYRVGRGGKPFRFYKLRTMVPDRRNSDNPYNGEERRLSHKTHDDPRITPVGARLRAWRLDELPQFINVIKGDMSLVGPRPELPVIVDGYEGWQHRRHEVKPGITGPWQVSHRNGTPMHEFIEMDIEYIENISLGRDLALMIKTPIAMFGGRRGY
jgi:lipopolysaccharide/colanic/teichoic acid biosynthesis glycosyltransferase